MAEGGGRRRVERTKQLDQVHTTTKQKGSRPSKQATDRRLRAGGTSSPLPRRRPLFVSFSSPLAFAIFTFRLFRLVFACLSVAGNGPTTLIVLLLPASDCIGLFAFVSAANWTELGEEAAALRPPSPM